MVCALTRNRKHFFRFSNKLPCHFGNMLGIIVRPIKSLCPMRHQDKHTAFAQNFPVDVTIYHWWIVTYQIVDKHEITRSLSRYPMLILSNSFHHAWQIQTCSLDLRRFLPNSWLIVQFEHTHFNLISPRGLLQKENERLQMGFCQPEKALLFGF